MWSGRGICQEFSFAVDIPTNLDGNFYFQYQIIDHSTGTYSPTFDGTSYGMGPLVNINACAKLLDDSGDWLFSIDVPFIDSVGGITYQTCDIIHFSQSSGLFSLYLDGGTLGLTNDVNIDTIAIEGTGDLIVSFDSPTTVSSTTYQPYDLALVSGGTLSKIFDGYTTGIPLLAGICGLDIMYNGDYIMTFDVPVSLSGSVFFPGDLVLYDGATFSLYFHESTFPLGSNLNGINLEFMSPGRVPDGYDVPGTQLMLAKNSTAIGDIDLTWDTSCLTTVSDYSIHEGTIGNWYSHNSINCSTGTNSATITPGSGNTYYLVVPLNEQFEGSYGVDSSLNQRLQSTNACRENQFIQPCPAP